MNIIKSVVLELDFRLCPEGVLFNPRPKPNHFRKLCQCAVEAKRQHWILIF